MLFSSTVYPQLAEVTQRFEGHRRDQEELELQLKEFAKQVTSSIPGDKYCKFLLRVYRRKVKLKPDAKKDGECPQGVVDRVGMATAYFVR